MATLQPVPGTMQPPEGDLSGLMGSPGGGESPTSSPEQSEAAAAVRTDIHGLLKLAAQIDELSTKYGWAAKDGKTASAALKKFMQTIVSQSPLAERQQAPAIAR